MAEGERRNDEVAKETTSLGEGCELQKMHVKRSLFPLPGEGPWLFGFHPGPTDDPPPSTDEPSPGEAGGDAAAPTSTAAGEEKPIDGKAGGEAEASPQSPTAEGPPRGEAGGEPKPPELATEASLLSPATQEPPRGEAGGGPTPLEPERLPAR